MIPTPVLVMVFVLLTASAVMGAFTLAFRAEEQRQKRARHYRPSRVYLVGVRARDQWKRARARLAARLDDRDERTLNLYWGMRHPMAAPAAGPVTTRAAASGPGTGPSPSSPAWATAGGPGRSSC